MHLISVTVYLFLVTLIVIIRRHKCRNRSCCCHGNAVFLVFPSSLFLTNRILRKVESWVLQPVGSEGQRPCFFPSAVSEGGMLWKGKVAERRGRRHVTVGVISGDAVHHFVNERLSAAVSPTSCLWMKTRGPVRLAERTEKRIRVATLPK